MERGDTPRCWAHRVIVEPPQEDRRQGNKRVDRERRRFSITNASQPVTTTKTNREGVHQTSYIHERHQNDIGKSHRLQPKPPSLPLSTSLTPRPPATRGANKSGDTSRDASIKQHNPRSSVISEHTNELINHEQDVHHKQPSLVARLSYASLQEAEACHPRRRVRRKSIDSRSFRSDDTGYSSQPPFPEESLRCSKKKYCRPKQGENESNAPLLRGRRASFSVGAGDNSSRVEYLKAFNDSIRLRNARKISTRQRPTSANCILPEIGETGPRNWRKLRLLVRSAPAVRGGRRASMDNGTSDSWEEFVALGMQVDDLIDIEKPSPSDAPTPRSIKNITSSREHERILNEFKFSGDNTYRKDGAFKKSIMVIAGGIKSMNMSNGGKSPRLSPRSKETSKPDAFNEEDEGGIVVDGLDLYDDDNDDGGKSTSKIRSRGWKIVKARLSEIAEKAPKNGIDSTPLTFKNIAQLVKAKQFRMMLKRRASFMDNGRFQFEEAKQDLYARYKLDPVLVSKLTHTPRDSQAGQSNSGGGAQK